VGELMNLWLIFVQIRRVSPLLLSMLICVNED